MGSSNENSAFGPVQNPWDLKRVSGGSSGGSAAAVALGLCPVSLGSDTGGSIRQPASFCGVVGFKPTYGAVSRFGLLAYASSLDQIGPIGSSVSDVQLIFDCIRGADTKDATSTDIPFSDCQRESLRKVACLDPKYLSGASEAVCNSLDQIVTRLKAESIQVDYVDIKSLESAIAAYYIVASAEASSNLARYDGVRFGYRDVSRYQNIEDMYRGTRTNGFGKEVKQRILVGTFVLSAGYYDQFYAKATRIRKQLNAEMSLLLDKYDCLMLPTTPTTAFYLGEKIDDPISMYLGDIYTVLANLTGQPALSIPVGIDQNGLPIGLQIIGKKYQDHLLLRQGSQYEKFVEWNKRPQL